MSSFFVGQAAEFFWFFPDKLLVALLFVYGLLKYNLGIFLDVFWFNCKRIQLSVLLPWIFMQLYSPLRGVPFHWITFVYHYVYAIYFCKIFSFSLKKPTPVLLCVGCLCTPCFNPFLLSLTNGKKWLYSSRRSITTLQSLLPFPISVQDFYHFFTFSETS